MGNFSGSNFTVFHHIAPFPLDYILRPYLAIGMLFNNALAFDQTPEVIERMKMVKKRHAIADR